MLSNSNIQCIEIEWTLMGKKIPNFCKFKLPKLPNYMFKDSNAIHGLSFKYFPYFSHTLPTYSGFHLIPSYLLPNDCFMADQMEFPFWNPLDIKLECKFQWNEV
jgi:hypothetical protein